jgi:hypothetical protein
MNRSPVELMGGRQDDPFHNVVRLPEDDDWRSPPSSEEIQRHWDHLEGSLANGTKQSGKEFNDKLNSILVQNLGMRRMKADPCVYTRGSDATGDQVIVVCHVDDYQFVGMTKAVEEEFLQDFQRILPSRGGGTCHEHLGVIIEQGAETRMQQTHRIEEYGKAFQVTTPSKKLRVLNFNGTDSPPMKRPELYS